MSVYLKKGPLKNKVFPGLLELMDAQDNLRSKCSHQKRFRAVECGIVGKANQNNIRAWTRVRCTRCGECLENHTTPRLSTKCPDKPKE